MSPDPFRALHHIDPPDQWDEITRRADDTGHAVDGVADLGVVRRHPRRRAVGLVAAAAVIALVAGGLVASTRDGDEDGVATTPATTTPGAAMDGPCPFTVDPGPPERVVTPGRTPVEPPTALVEMAMDDPSLDLEPWTDGSWGRTTVEGTEVAITVYGDGGTDLTPVGPFTDARLVDDARGRELSITGTSVIESSGACRTVQVQLRAGLTEADAAARQAAVEGGQDDPDEKVDLDPYIEQHDDLVNRVLGAVRLVEGGPDRRDDPCQELVDSSEAPVGGAPGQEPALPYTFGGETGDGRAFTVEVRTEPEEGDVVWVDVAGNPDWGGGGTLPSGPGSQSWSWTGDDAGILVGWRPPTAVATAALRPDGTLATEGLVLSPGATLFALPDVGQVLDPSGETETWPIVHCDAAGEAVVEPAPDDPSLGDVDEELSEEIQEDAEAHQQWLQVLEHVEGLDACQADPAACPDDAYVTTSGPAGEQLLVADVPGLGLCLMIDREQATCDGDLGIGPDDDPTTVRHVTDPFRIWFGRLPPGLTAADGVAPLLRDEDDTILPTPGASNGQLWVMSMAPDGPDTADAEVRFRRPDGTTVVPPIVGG